MTLHIIQHGLRDLHTHYWNESLGWQEAAKSLGINCIVYANRSVSSALRDEAGLVPAFSSPPLSIREKNTKLRPLFDYIDFSTELFKDCTEYLTGRVGREDNVIIPYSTDREMLGVAMWLESLTLNQKPNVSFVFHHGDLTWKISEDRRVVSGEFGFWIYAARRITRAAAERRVFLGAVGPRLDEVLSKITGLPARSVAWMQNGIVMKGDISPDYSDRDVDVGVLGEFRWEHGASDLPQILLHDSMRHPDWRYMIHVRSVEQDQQIRAAFDRHGRGHQIEVVVGDIPHDEFYGRMSRCRLIILNYRTERYRLRSSGMLYDAVALGVPVIVPGETTLSDLVESGAASGIVLPPRAGKEILYRALDIPDWARQKMVVHARNLAIQWRQRNAPERVLRSLLPELE